jgi:hypothetical protein
MPGQMKKARSFGVACCAGRLARPRLAIRWTEASAIGAVRLQVRPGAKPGGTPAAWPGSASPAVSKAAATPRRQPDALESRIAMP